MEVACQAPLSVGFLRQEYWSGLLFPSSGDFLDPGIKPCLLHWQVDSLSLSHQESPMEMSNRKKNVKLLKQFSEYSTLSNFVPLFVLTFCTSAGNSG